jgi:hypothetical protein
MDPKRKQMLHLRIDELVANRDKMIISVGGDQNANAFFYSIGMTSMGLPELIISGNANPVIQHAMIEMVAEMYRAKGVSLGIHDDLLASKDGRNLRMALVEVDCSNQTVRDEYIAQAISYYEAKNHSGPIRLVQLVWPDKQGRLPDEPGYDMASKQDILPSLAQAKLELQDTQTTLPDESVHHLAHQQRSAPKWVH